LDVVGSVLREDKKMGFMSEVDIEVQEMVEKGATFAQIKNAFPMLREDEIDEYLANQDHLDDDDFDDSMDGDHESALASAGFGMDESYGYYGEEY
jgi:hypothetical protein